MKGLELTYLQYELLRRLLRVGVLSLLVDNRWREAQVWLRAGLDAGVPELGAMAAEACLFRLMELLFPDILFPLLLPDCNESARGFPAAEVWLCP